jgi:Zn-finger nucleic acid-binding protein
MSLSHHVLTLACPQCGVQFVRVAKSAYADIAVCPKCHAWGMYETVLEEGVAESRADSLAPEIRSYLAGI